MKRGGQPGNIAINPQLVTYVRSSSGPFTDIHFGEHHVSVEGTFDQVVAKLLGDPNAGMQPAVRSWIKTG
jgi:purine nucleoside phosphorylase